MVTWSTCVPTKGHGCCPGAQFTLKKEDNGPHVYVVEVPGIRDIREMSESDNTEICYGLRDSVETICGYSTWDTMGDCCEDFVVTEWVQTKAADDMIFVVDVSDGYSIYYLTRCLKGVRARCTACASEYMFHPKELEDLEMCEMRVSSEHGENSPESSTTQTDENA